VHRLGDFPLDGGLFVECRSGGGRGFAVQAVSLARELLTELLEQFLIPEALLHCFHDPPLDLFAAYRQAVRADAAVASTGAAWIDAGSVVNPAALTGSTYDVQFSVVDETFEVLRKLGHSESDARRLIDGVLGQKKKFKDVQEILAAIYEKSHG
jgi:hypothetical protein